MKKCSRCKELKPFSDFNKNRSNNDGLTAFCKHCNRKVCKDYKRTREGVASQIYNSQKSSSRKRGHKPPSYNKKTLKNWLLKHPLFEKLFNNWKNSGYNRMLRPSIDRKKDNLPYTLNNIQLMTWNENEAKGHIDQQKAVIQYTKQGLFVAEYISINKANLMTSIDSTGISRTCQGIRNYAGGYKWAFKK